MKPVYIWFVLLLAVGCGCGESEAPGSAQSRDFVGTKSAALKPAVKKKAASAKAETAVGVDLITDVSFRYLRDDWTLTSADAQVNVERLKQSGIQLVFAAIGNSGQKLSIDDELKVMEKLVGDAGPNVALISRLDDVVDNAQRGVVSVAVLVEGAAGLSALDDAALLALKKRGVLAVDLIDGNEGVFGDSADNPRDLQTSGLTPRGRKFVEKLASLGIAIDLTHASKQTFYDVLIDQGALGFVSHGAVDYVRKHRRNLDDLQILTLARNGAVMGLSFNPEFLKTGQGAGTASDVLRHMRHVKRLGAMDALALGTDYDGIRPPTDLPHIGSLQSLGQRLLREGFSAVEVKGIMGDNAWKYLENVNARYGTAEMTQGDVLRPLVVECESVIGEYEGGALLACDRYMFSGAVTVMPSAKHKIRLKEVSRKPVRLELWGIPQTPWQVEGQSLNGRIMMKRVVLLNEQGRGTLTLPRRSGLIRLFLSPTRKSELHEAVVWGI